MSVNYEQVVTEILTHLQDNKLKTFDVIFQSEENEASPVICVEHNLGIESWCIKDLYRQAYDIIFRQTSVTSPVHYDVSMLILLLLNPNIKTLWNKRRTLVLDGKSSTDFEINFTKLVLTYKPKSQDAVNYRKWLLKTNNLISREHFMLKDLDLILDAASRHTNNHIVWDYAIWFLNSTDTRTLVNLCVKLWDQITSWISVNVSDYSALHFRQYLIEKLTEKDIVPLIDNSFKKKIMLAGLEFIGSILKVSDENVAIECCRKFETPEYASFFSLGILLVDFELNDNLISFYNDREAFWNHRRFICHHFLYVLPTVVPDLSKKLFSNLISNIKFSSAGDIFDTNEFNLFEFLFLKIHSDFLFKCENIENQRHSQKFVDWLVKSKMLNDCYKG